MMCIPGEERTCVEKGSPPSPAISFCSFIPGQQFFGSTRPRYLKPYTILADVLQYNNTHTHAHTCIYKHVQKDFLYSPRKIFDTHEKCARVCVCVCARVFCTHTHTIFKWSGRGIPYIQCRKKKKFDSTVTIRRERP